MSITDSTPVATDWETIARPPSLFRRYVFDSYGDTRAFLNDLAALSAETGCYPDLGFGRTHVNVTVHGEGDRTGSAEHAFAGRVSALAGGAPLARLMLRNGATAFASADIRRGESTRTGRPDVLRARSTSAAPVTNVGVAIVQSADGRVLLAERTASQIGAGFWELPGGKIDAHESPGEAALRELREEVGVVATSARAGIVYEHAFRTKRVRLHFFHVDAWSGTPHGREGQRVTWADPARLAVGPILPSNERIMFALGLPPLYIMTPGRAFIGWLKAGGLRELARPEALIGIRDMHGTPEQRATTGRRVVELVRPFGMPVVIAGTALEAHRAGAIGIHSTAAELRRITARPAIRFWVVTCQNDDDAERAVALGADAAVISPVLEPMSGSGPLGWDGFSRIAARLPIPVYAQGGMSPSLLAIAQRSGAVGIATDASGALRTSRNETALSDTL